MAVQRKPTPTVAVDNDDKAAEAFIKGGGAPTPQDEAKPKRQDNRKIPRFSIRMDRETLDDLEDVLPAAKRYMKLPGHMKLSKSDFVEWCIREGIERVRKAEERKG